MLLLVTMNSHSLTSPPRTSSPPRLYNCLRVRFPIFLPPLSLHPCARPVQPHLILAHLYIPSYPYRFLSQWLSLLLQSLPQEAQDLLPLPLDKAPLPLNANTERCSRMVPVKSGPRASKRPSWKVRAVIAPLVFPSAVPRSDLDVSSPVSGLRQYWESPWATYSRGRSRWRNQFLVDYLKEAGIERSKKQVASHIQVLRNMWKGEKGMSRTSDSSFGVFHLWCFFFSFANQNIN